MAPDSGITVSDATASFPGPARARASCSRCHKRKKRCDRALPACDNCVSAHANCSFEDDDLQIASYPIAYIRNLEEQIRLLRQGMNIQGDATPRAGEAVLVQNDNHPGADPHSTEGLLANPRLDREDSSDNEMGNTDMNVDERQSSGQLNLAVTAPTILHERSTLDQELSAISLEAAADRYLGSTSGLSFAKLTQMVLRRLSPDKADFVFVSQENATTANLMDFESPGELFNNSFYQSLSESVSVHPLLFGDLFLSDITGPDMALESLTWPGDETHVRRLVDFYFAHSHTLYPIVNRSEIMATLDQIRHNPQNLSTQTPLNTFRVWMILAIGSTAHSSITLSEESESILFYSKAMQYFEAAFSGGDMSALEVIMLQVSYSFFNQLGPNTWYLVGTAARLAVGMGLHTASTYNKFPVDVQQRRKRLFFSIYMMDRVVSITLGRPFAIHDDDVDVTPFENVDEELVHADGINPHNHLQPSLMAVPLHLLSLRRIAGRISRQVYGNSRNANLPVEEREAIISSLHQELLDWRRSTPFPLPDVDDSVPHHSTTWYDFNYYTHLAMIYRPSPLFPKPDLKRVKTLEMAASMSLRSAFSMHRQQRFAYNWLNFLSLFTSTLSVVYSATAQPDELGSILKETRAIADLDLAAELFEIFGFKFAAAKKVKSMIAEISQRYKTIVHS